MRVLQVTYSYKPIIGGADVYADDLRRVLEADGVEVGVLQRPLGPAERTALQDSAVITFPRLFAWGNAFWLQPLALPLMRRALKQWDVLVCHYPNYCVGCLGHPRLIGLSHGVFWDDRPRSLAARVKRSLARKAFRQASRYVANDTFFLREVGLDISPGQQPFSEVVPGRWYVPNAVDVQHFCPGPPAPEAEPLRPFVLVPRNIYLNRGVHLAVEAFARVSQQWPDYRLVVVGHEGQREAVELAQAAVEKHGLGERVVFAGGRSRDELIGWYRAAALTLIPSLCGEGTSLAALESMACGTPVVSTDVGGLPDLPCLAVPPQPEALAEAINRALAERDSLAAEQLAAVREGFNMDLWAAAWRHIVEDW